VGQCRADVEGGLRAERDPADLDDLVDGTAHEPGGDEDEDDAGPAKEPPEVEPSASAVEREPQPDRDQQPDGRAGEYARRTRAAHVGCRGRGLPDQEQRGLQPFPDDRREREERQAPDAPGREDPIERALELARHRARLAAHPEQHPRHDGGRDQHRRALEDLLPGCLQLAERREDHQSQSRAGRHSGRHAQPDPAEVSTVAGPGQVGADDADDQGGFRALAQAGQQAAREGADVEHAGSSMGTRGPRSRRRVRGVAASAGGIWRGEREPASALALEGQGCLQRPRCDPQRGRRRSAAGGEAGDQPPAPWAARIAARISSLPTISSKLAAIRPCASTTKTNGFTGIP
jgi:hypothetical protein